MMKPLLLCLLLGSTLAAQSHEGQLRERLKGSLAQVRNLSPEQQQRVIATLEAQAKVASPSLKPILEALVEDLRNTLAQQPPAAKRVRAQLQRIAKLTPAQRQAVILQVEKLAKDAPAELKPFWEQLLEVARTLPDKAS